MYIYLCSGYKGIMMVVSQASRAIGFLGVQKSPKAL